MSPVTFQLKYDELAQIAKRFKDEGEDIAKLHSVTRARVRDMRKEWVGEAAERFFAEMENEVLPALERLSRALFFTQDVTLNISKIIRNADEETATYFKNRLGDDFGASRFSGALEGLQGMRPGADDFGASQFGAALGGAPGGGGGADDFGAGKFQEAGSATDGGQTSQGQPGNQDARPEQESSGPDKDNKLETESAMAGGGGGGGGSSGESQGLKGDLKNMGAGLGEQAAQSGAMGASGGAMSDTIYSGSGGAGGGSGGGQPQPAAPGAGGGGASSESAPDAGSAAAAAGAAGVVGSAAAGGAAKVIKDQKANDNK